MLFRKETSYLLFYLQKLLPIPSNGSCCCVKTLVCHALIYVAGVLFFMSSLLRYFSGEQCIGDFGSCQFGWQCSMPGAFPNWVHSEHLPCLLLGFITKLLPPGWICSAQHGVAWQLYIGLGRELPFPRHGTWGSLLWDRFSMLEQWFSTIPWVSIMEHPQHRTPTH